MSDATQRLNDVLGVTEQLLATDSVYGDERALCDDLHARFAARSHHALIRAGDSLCIVPRRPREGASTLLLVGHLDTVPKLDDNPVRRDEDHLFGLGASDMKAGDAVIIWALEQALARAPRHDLVAVLYAREEGPFEGSEMPAIRDAARPWLQSVDLAICMEPTDNRIELGALGTSHAAVRFSGKRAHSARPWHGDNAIQKAAGLLQRLAAFGRVEHSFHGLTFYEAMSATMIDYRGARNVIPDQCTVNVNYRFAPGKDEAQVRRDLDAMVQGEAEWELADFCPAGLVCGDNALLAELKACLPGVEVAAKQAWTDVGRLSHWGIDAINWGPGSTSQAHQAGEWVSVAEIGRSVETLWGWLFG